MKRIVLNFGLLLGLLLSAQIAFMIYWMYRAPHIQSNDVLGYATMLLIFSLIFFGTRRYRNQYLAGQIRFGNGFRIGALIALAGATLYVLTWLITYYLFVPDFMDVYSDYVLKNCTQEDLAAKTEEMAQFREWYRNPLMVILITYMEVLPLGLAVALVSAAILRKKPNNGQE